MFREPRWTTPNRIALELPSMRLREFSAGGDNIATLVCAPLALHDATLTDFAPDHSLVAALQMAGLRERDKRRPDCVAGVRGLELGNPRTSHVFEIL